MTENEAVEYLLSRYLVVGSPVNPPKEECEKHNDALDVAIYALTAIQEYKAIGTIEDFKALKEKSVAKKAIRRTGMCYAKAKDGTDNYEIIEECPTCKKRLCAVSFNVGYCKCGQRITI